LCQRRVARALVIDSPNRIAESGYVTIGGIGQWIQIRGADTGNPVLLFLHGSGMTMTPFTPAFRGWEKHFTVVRWDRRGVGRTLRRNGKEADQLTFDLMAEDGIEVAEYLCGRLRTDRVILSAKAVKELEKTGPPPYPSGADLAGQAAVELRDRPGAAIEAPRKDLVLLPAGGHCAVLMQPDAFLAELRARISAAEVAERGSAGRP
jgi:pimeloyl-ACP methyl ester carboxylesterase